MRKSSILTSFILYLSLDYIPPGLLEEEDYGYGQ